MATVNNPWLRGVSGKVAGMVVQGGTTRGTTIIRERVTPTDPKTTAQRIQRIIMSTVGQAYAKMSELADHAFEGYNGKAANMNRFRSLNANMLRQFVASKDAADIGWQDMYDFSPKGIQWLASNAWIMSEGSLPRIPFTLTSASGQVDIPTGIPTSDWAPGDSMDYKDLFSDPVNEVPHGLTNLGMKEGDQITICGIRSGLRANPSTGVYGDVTEPAIFSYCRLILTGNKANSIAFDITGSDGDSVTGGTFKASAVSPLTQLNGWTVSLAVKEGYFYLRFTQPFTTLDWQRNTIGCATAILSRKVNNKWLRSPSTMNARTLPDEPKLSAFSLGEALYRERTSINTESDYYLNNAQQVAG